jgi:hypothetical protein
VATRLAKAAGAREVRNQIEISPEAKARSQARPHAPTNPRQLASPRQSANPRQSTSPHQPPKAAPPPGSAPPTSFHKEPEAILQNTASNEGSPAKKFRILSGPSSGTPTGSARQARVRRY